MLINPIEVPFLRHKSPSQVFLAGTSGKILESNSYYFSNPAMALGSVIKTWTSRNTYQSDREIPLLPLLYPERLYHLDYKIDMSPESSLYFEIIFYNLHDEELQKLVFKEPGFDFKLPIDCFYYKLKMRSYGCHYFTFDCLIISEKIEERD